MTLNVSEQAQPEASKALSWTQKAPPANGAAAKAAQAPLFY
ncbi:hypothetical protein [Xylella fastidiosa]|nr:hypothetical protein [Xylella fastidiosa]